MRRGSSWEMAKVEEEMLDPVEDAEMERHEQSSDPAVPIKHMVGGLEQSVSKSGADRRWQEQGVVQERLEVPRGFVRLGN